MRLAKREVTRMGAARPLVPVPGLALCVMLAAFSTSYAHVGARVFPIYELPTADLPDLDDGTLEDWEDVVSGASLDVFDFRASTEGWEGPDASDLAWRVFLAWHDATQRVFVAVERIDDVFIMDDHFEFTAFMIDGDHSGGRYLWYSEEELTESEMRDNYSQAQWYGPGLPRSDGRLVVAPGAATNWLSEPPWTEAGGGVLFMEPHDFVVEFEVTPWDYLSVDGPESSIRSLLEPGGVIGFQMLVSDTDESGQIKGQYTIDPATMSDIAQYADNFVDGVLIPCSTGDCSGTRTAVQDDSWGRIKASLR